MFCKTANPRLENRIEDLFNYKIPDKVPIGSMSVGFNAVNAGYRVREILKDAVKCFQAAVWTARRTTGQPCPSIPDIRCGVEIDFWGEVRMPSDRYESSLIITSHPVQSEKDLENLNLPDPKAAGRIPLAIGFAQRQAENGFPVFFSSRSPFTMAANICGLENFCRWKI